MIPYLKTVAVIKDIHTHNIYNDAIISIEPGDAVIADKYYSVGIHPWNSGSVDDDMLRLLDTYARYDNVVAIGETGIDGLKGGSVDRQKDLFIKHAALSSELKKPLIIHAVRSFNDIIELHKRLKPGNAWIIHGFRGNENIAVALLKEGFYLSYGELFNELSLLNTPIDRMLIETDCSEYPVEDIYSIIAGKLGMNPDILEKKISANVQRLFPYIVN